MKAAEEMGCFRVFIAFVKLKTSPVSVASVKHRAVHQTLCEHMGMFRFRYQVVLFWFSKYSSAGSL